MKPPRLATFQSMKELCLQLETTPRIALDTEFHAERRYIPRLFLIQLQIEDGDTWILDPMDKDNLELLAEPLCSVPWIVHSGRHDIALMHRALGSLPSVILDTQVAAGLVTDHYPTSYAALVSHFLHRELSKAGTLSNWAKRPLSASQLEYAANDVRLLLPLWDELESMGRTLNRSDEILAACAEEMNKVLNPPPNDTLWRSLPAAGILTPQQAAVMQTLCGWRETQGRESDQPVRTILSDGLMTTLSRRQPETLGDLTSIRLAPKGLIKRHGDQIVELIHRAAHRPDWGLPQVIRNGSDLWRTRQYLTCFLMTDGHANQYAPALVAPKPLLDTIVLSAPDTYQTLCALLGTWRSSVCGAALWRAIQGQDALRLANNEPGIFTPKA